MTDTSIDWVPWETRKWVAGTAELDADAEYVFFRLCLLAYDTGSALLDRSARRLALWCKYDLARYEGALGLLIETNKAEMTEGGLFIPSAEKRILEATAKIGARQIGAAKSRRIGVLKREGRTSEQIAQIISDEFPDVQGQKPTEKSKRNNSTPEDRTLEGFLGETAPLRAEYDVAFELYNAMAKSAGLSIAQVLTDTRQRAIKARLKEAGGLEGWKIALAKVEGSPFLTGKRQPDFRADLDFILQKSRFVKLMEGGYDPMTSGKAQQISGVMAALAGMKNGE